MADFVAACAMIPDGAVHGLHGDRDPVIAVCPAALGEWPEGSAEAAAPTSVERPLVKTAAEEYRIYILEGGIVRSCQQSGAAGDRAALAQARFCEPAKAFELWRGHLFVTRQPSIK
jgi:hypothetical protein